MSVTTNLGKVACVGKGEFNASARYEALDIISYTGSSYLVIAPCTGIYPPNENYYMLLASKGDTGARGERGATGATGARGEKGDTGTGLDIKGTYASIDALSAAVASPEQGDMYFIGTAAPYTVYMWDTTSGTGAWISQGALQGTKGDAGAVFTPNVTVAGVLSWTNNGGLTNPSSVNIKGPQGERGDVGIGVPAGGWQGQILSKATDADYDGEWITPDANVVGAIPKSEKGAASGVATLDANGKVEAEQTNALVVTHEGLTEYTISAADMGKFHRFLIADGTTATCDVTLPDDGDSIPIGSEIEIMKMNSGLTLNIVCETDVYIYTQDKWNNSTISLDGSYGLCALKKMADKRWVARGDIA